jgi:hypothetical protein
VLTNININSKLATNAGPDKGWNDPCLLLAEDWRGNLRMTKLQTRAQFSMWSVMASPLIISANIRNMSTENIATFTNSEVIAVDQDLLGLQGERVLGGDLSAKPSPPGGAGGGGVPDGTPLVLAKCDATDPKQKWEAGGAAPGGPSGGGGGGGAGAAAPPPPGTIFSPALRMMWNSFDCGPKLVMWHWVTNGCDHNMGFDFRPSSSGQQLVSPLGTHGTQCVTAAASSTPPPMGSPLELAACNTTSRSSSTFRLDRSTGLIHFGTAAASAGHGGGGGLCVSVGGGAPSLPASTTNVWVRRLSGGRAALVFLNVGGTAAPNVTCDGACIRKTGLQGQGVTVRDLWEHRELGTRTKLTSLSATELAPEGGHLMLLLTPTKKQKQQKMTTTVTTERP